MTKEEEKYNLSWPFMNNLSKSNLTNLSQQRIYFPVKMLSLNTIGCTRCVCIIMLMSVIIRIITDCNNHLHPLLSLAFSPRPLNVSCVLFITLEENQQLFLWEAEATVCDHRLCPCTSVRSYPNSPCSVRVFFFPLLCNHPIRGKNVRGTVGETNEGGWRGRGKQNKMKKI